MKSICPSFVGRSRAIGIASLLLIFGLPLSQAQAQFGNTSTGLNALANNTTGVHNTATGYRSLNMNTSGGYNTATGSYTLEWNSSGNYNTAAGIAALNANTTGDHNTAAGSYSLQSNSSGHDNTATGSEALQSNTTGNNNTAAGSAALENNTTGWQNTAAGSIALFNNTTGAHNTAAGSLALYANTTGLQNTAMGESALFSNSTGSKNIAVGRSAGRNLTTGDNNIDIGHLGVAGESGRIRIGTQGTQVATYIAGIHGVTTSSGTQVYVNSSGQLGTVTSSKRFKEKIIPMDKESEAVLALQPVSFRYKEELDSKSTPQFGLVAEEVEKVSPDLVIRDQEGKVYSVRYEAVNAMLLNEFLKAHRKVEQLEAALTDSQATTARHEKEIGIVTATLREQATQIQKVSARLAVEQSAPAVVASNQ